MKQEPNLPYHLMRASLATYQCRFAELEPAQKTSVLEQGQTALMIETLVLESAVARDVVIPDQVIDRAFHGIAERFADRGEFTADLAANALDEDSLCLSLERELKADATLEKVALGAAVVTNEDVRHYFDAHPEKFTIGETRQTRHILITVNEELEENSREEAQRRIRAILQELDGSSRQFSEMALRHSECPTAMNGGLLGRVPRGKLFTELEEVLFEMKAETVSDVVETEAGFHILHCEQIYPQQTASLEGAAPKIRNALENARKAKAQREFVSGLLAARKR
ncbi:nitrogen fixation protein NifM [uncultured Cohaesibacter sp.]|uniref:nitrogen fixation protein NifM n=1 Tax=uncultured Cohaesibacter sp. TaxID=1002546 RepID=UPI00292EC509|nr:nitrogen fixation protein NifM [uncultured Cohaesibacter sp.]